MVQLKVLSILAITSSTVFDPDADFLGSPRQGVLERSVSESMLLSPLPLTEESSPTSSTIRLTPGARRKTVSCENLESLSLLQPLPAPKPEEAVDFDQAFEKDSEVAIQKWLSDSKLFSTLPCNSIRVTRFENSGQRNSGTFSIQVKIDGPQLSPRYSQRKFFVKVNQINSAGCAEFIESISLNQSDPSKWSINEGYPHIPQVLEIGFSSQRCFGLFERARGESIENLVHQFLNTPDLRNKRQAFLSLQKAFSAWGKALGKMHHSAGWTHQDLHNGNVLYDSATDRIAFVDNGKLSAKKPYIFEDLNRGLNNLESDLITGLIAHLNPVQSEIEKLTTPQTYAAPQEPSEAPSLFTGPGESSPTHEQFIQGVQEAIRASSRSHHDLGQSPIAALPDSLFDFNSDDALASRALTDLILLWIEAYLSEVSEDRQDEIRDWFQSRFEWYYSEAISRGRLWSYELWHESALLPYIQQTHPELARALRGDF